MYCKCKEAVIYLVFNIRFSKEGVFYFVHDIFHPEFGLMMDFENRFTYNWISFPSPSNGFISIETLL